MKGLARRLRKNPTDAERALWRHLRLRQMGRHRFRRQQPIGSYIVDFVCFEDKLILEVDGGGHVGREDEDGRRTAWLESQGFRAMRFWDHEVLTEIEAVKERIQQSLAPHLNPPPQGGRKRL